jgi:hypothetical protein
MCFVDGDKLSLTDSIHLISLKARVDGYLFDLLWRLRGERVAAKLKS